MWSSIQILTCAIPNRWVRFGKDLELLDSPGILPMRISDQTAALKLAICDDIGERSYDFADVAAILVQILLRHPAVGEWFDNLMMRYYVLTPVHHILLSTCKTKHFLPFHYQVWVLFSCTCMRFKTVADGVLHETGAEAFRKRYKIDVDSDCGKMYALIICSSFWNDIRTSEVEPMFWYCSWRFAGLSRSSQSTCSMEIPPKQLSASCLTSGKADLAGWPWRDLQHEQCMEQYIGDTDSLYVTWWLQCPL